MADRGDGGVGGKKLTVLAAMLARHPDELRADLQQWYGVDIDRAFAGEHSISHVACLAAQLPSDARTRVAEDPDALWTLNDILTAQVLNAFVAANSKKGSRPKPVLPSYLRNERKLAAMVMPVDELERKLAEFSKPRK